MGQHSELVAIGKRGNEQIDRREAVMSAPGELSLALERSPLDRLVEVAP